MKRVGIGFLLLFLFSHIIIVYVIVIKETLVNIFIQYHISACSVDKIGRTKTENNNKKLAKSQCFETQSVMIKSR